MPYKTLKILNKQEGRMKYLYNGRGADDVALQRKMQVIERKYDEALRALRIINGTKGDMAFGNMNKLQAQAETAIEKFLDECRKHLSNIKQEVNRKGGDELIPLSIKRK